MTGVQTCALPICEQTERDRQMAARTQADTEYLARELAGVRLALADVVTTQDLKDQLEHITEMLEKLSEQQDSRLNQQRGA